MNIIIDIAHPGHVHLFRHLSAALQRRGHQVYYSVRDIPVAIRLMEQYGMTPYCNLGAKGTSLLQKAKRVAQQDFRLLKLVREKHIDLGISSGISLAHVSKLTSMTALQFDDDDDATEPLVVRYGHPFSTAVFTPDSIRRKTPHAIYYPSTHELAYLHPDLFSPDPTVLQRAGIQRGERFFIMRFVAFQGHHDVGQYGLAKEQKLAIVRMLQPHGRVVITSEKALEPEFEPYRLPVPPEEIHSLMAYSSLFVGDSQTMTSEAAVLGVPALKCNTFAGRLSVPNMLEQKYRLCFAYTPEQYGDMIRQMEQLLAIPSPTLHAEWQHRRTHMLGELINPVPYFADYIETHYGLHV